MEFFSYSYLVEQGQYNAFLQYGVTAMGLIIFLGVGVQALSHRYDTKYRDLAIIMLLFATLGIGIQYSDYSRTVDDAQNTSRMVYFVDVLSERLGADKNDIYTNSTRLRSGMIVRVNEVYYEVDFTNNMEAYSLRRIQMLTDTVTIRQRQVVQ